MRFLQKLCMKRTTQKCGLCLTVLNAYNYGTLHRQEKLNARWFEWFKQTAYKLAAEGSSLEAWEAMRIFNSQQIARMKEVDIDLCRSGRYFKRNLRHQP